MDGIPTAVWEGTFEMYGVTVNCYVLDNGMRIVNADDMAAMFDAMATSTELGDIEGFARWQKGTPQ